MRKKIIILMTGVLALSFVATGCNGTVKEDKTMISTVQEKSVKLSTKDIKIKNLNDLNYVECSLQITQGEDSSENHVEIDNKQGIIHKTIEDGDCTAETWYQNKRGAHKTDDEKWKRYETEAEVNAYANMKLDDYASYIKDSSKWTAVEKEDYYELVSTDGSVLNNKDATDFKFIIRLDKSTHFVTYSKVTYTSVIDEDGCTQTTSVKCSMDVSKEKTLQVPDNVVKVMKGNKS